jgi:hypothetical protein
MEGRERIIQGEDLTEVDITEEEMAVEETAVAVVGEGEVIEAMKWFSPIKGDEAM